MTFYTYYLSEGVSPKQRGKYLLGRTPSSMQQRLLFFFFQKLIVAVDTPGYIPTPRHISQCRFIDSGTRILPQRHFPPVLEYYTKRVSNPATLQAPHTVDPSTRS